MPLVKHKEAPGQAETEHGPDLLTADLAAPEAAVRRAAARDIAAHHPEMAMALCDRLAVETSASVRLVIVTSLIQINTPEVAARLADHLRSEDAQLRNIAIEALQEMPDAVVPLLDRLLVDKDSDVRIFAVNILSVICHREAPERLARVLRTDPHVNVCAAALDGLTEVGGRAAIPDIEALGTRFAGNAFMRFAVGTAIRRIRAAE
jgi:HEAT repeat protein